MNTLSKLSLNREGYWPLSPKVWVFPHSHRMRDKGAGFPSLGVVSLARIRPKPRANKLTLPSVQRALVYSLKQWAWRLSLGQDLCAGLIQTTVLEVTVVGSRTQVRL